MTPPRIGLALSGGGSRAIAFHLGCLRALHELGILTDVEVVSTVSGGSVIGAMFAANRDTFPEFEANVRRLLSQGLMRPTIHKALTTTEGLKALFCFLLLLLSGLVSTLLTWAGMQNSRATSRLASLRRFASRTTLFRQVLEDDVFGGRRLNDLPTTGPLLIVNAAELRTGSAFYFSRQSSGSWRFGELADPNVTVGHAVTASAAYPLLLPALDEIMPFKKRDGYWAEDRVTLTDGGVYDNLGLAPLWPDRDPNVSLNVTDIDTIICCRAGYGLRTEPPSKSFIARLKSALFCIHGRAQNAAIKRLFDLKAAGVLNGFLIPYLGQDDRRLKYPPEDLVTREDAYDYPTNFSAMSDEWIEKLSRRGEQLTKALVFEHLPELANDLDE